MFKRILLLIIYVLAVVNLSSCGEAGGPGEPAVSEHNPKASDWTLPPHMLCCQNPKEKTQIIRMAWPANKDMEANGYGVNCATTKFSEVVWSVCEPLRAKQCSVLSDTMRWLSICEMS